MTHPAKWFEISGDETTQFEKRSEAEAVADGQTVLEVAITRRQLGLRWEEITKSYSNHRTFKLHDGPRIVGTVHSTADGRWRWHLTGVTNWIYTDTLEEAHEQCADVVKAGW